MNDYYQAQLVVEEVLAGRRVVLWNKVVKALEVYIETLRSDSRLIPGYTNQIRKLTEQNDALNKQLAKAQAEVEQLKGRVDSTVSDNKKVRGLERALQNEQRDRADLENALELKNREVNDLRSTNEQLRGQIARLAIEAESLLALAREAEGCRSCSSPCSSA